MTATVSGISGGWAAAHRRVLAYVALAIALAAAATVGIVLLLSSSPTSAVPATTDTGAREWPVPPDQLTAEEKCHLARVRVC